MSQILDDDGTITDPFIRNYLDLLCFLLSGLPADGTIAAEVAFMFNVSPGTALPVACCSQHHCATAGSGCMCSGLCVMESACSPELAGVAACRPGSSPAPSWSFPR